jgi:hypothetical protein
LWFGNWKKKKEKKQEKQKQKQHEEPRLIVSAQKITTQLRTRESKNSEAEKKRTKESIMETRNCVVLEREDEAKLKDRRIEME